VVWGLRVGFGVLVAGLLSCGGGAKPAPNRAGAKRDSSEVGGRPRRTRKAQGDSLAQKAGKSAARAAKSAARAAGVKGKKGTLKAMTPEERAIERKKQREEKRRLRQEMRRRKREERLAERMARNRGRRSKGKRSLYDAYTLKGTVGGRYALIGSRRLEVGDVIAGKRIVAVESDRVVLEQFGSRFSVRIGDPVEKTLQTKRRR
jgi:hypothetical protein